MKYLVTLKPLDKFFFGREQTFGEENYFAKSVYFPQQTQILGMLRRELLIQNDCMTQKRRGEWVDDKHHHKAKELVGKEQFKIDSSSKQELEKIESISELFMLNRDKKLAFISAKDRGIKFGQAEELIELKFRETEKLYKEKEANKLSTLIYVENEEPYKMEDVFKEDTQVGIQKSYQGSTKDNAFFKKTSYKLDFDFSFAFVLELKEKNILSDAIVTLGAERSQFKMEVREDPLCESYREKIAKFYQSDSVDKLILLSDTYMECNSEEIFSKATFAMTESTAIRTINEKMTKRVKDVDLTNYKFRKSITYNFFKQGSVFYEPKGLEELIVNENLQQIGYNQYIIIKGEENE